MALRMREDKNVTQFARRFWTVYSQIECASEEMAVKSFQLALRPGIQLRAQLVMYPVATMKELMTRANWFIRVEEDEVHGWENFGLSQKDRPSKGDRDNRSSRKENRRKDPSPDRHRARSSDRRRNPSTSVAASGSSRRTGNDAATFKAVNTIFKEPIYKLLHKIKAQPFFMWLQPMKSDPSSRD